MKKFISLLVSVIMTFGTLSVVWAETPTEKVRQIYDVFDDYDNKTDGADINNHNSTKTGEWKYAASAENGTKAVSYKKLSRDGNSNNIVAAHGDIKNQARFFPQSTTITKGAFETDIMFDTGSNSTAEYQLRFNIITGVDESTGKETTKSTSLVIKWTGKCFTCKAEGISIGDIEVSEDLQPGKWINLKVVCDAVNQKIALSMNGKTPGNEATYDTSYKGTIKFTDFKNATSGCVTYMDNTSLTDCDSEDYLYYGTPEALNIEAILGEDISELYAEIPYVLEDGSNSGYKVRKQITHSLTTDEPGVFSEEAQVEGTQISVTLNLTVVEAYSVKAPETVYIAGDSTSANYLYYQRPKSGWGEMLGYYLENVKVENKAVGGRSAKSFIDEGRLDNILNSASEGDYLLIQFGHNDRPLTVTDNSEDKRSTPLEYKDYLRSYISSAKEKGINPVLVTSIVEANYTDGILSETNVKYEYQLGEYAQAMREVATETETPLIDAYKLTSEFFNRLGEEESKKYYLFCEATNYWTKAQTDTTHLQQLGAQTVAEMIASELKKLEAFKDVVREPLRNYDIAKDYVTENFESYTNEDIGKQVWAQPFSLFPNQATDNFTVEYENADGLNKVGKMRGKDESLGDTSNERATVFFNKLAGGIGEIGMRAKLGSAVNDKIELQIYGRESILTLLRLSSDSSGRYKLTSYYPGESTGTTVKITKDIVPYVFENTAGEEIQTIKPDEWFDIKFVMHEDTRSYDIYINGFEAGINIPYFNYGYELTPEQLEDDSDLANVYYRAEKMYIYAGSQSDSILYIDDVYAKDYMSYAEPIAMEMNAYRNETCILPKTAPVRMDDGHTVVNLPVEWKSTPDTQNIGEQTIFGTIGSINKETSICVNVKALPLEFDGFVLKNGYNQVFSTSADETNAGTRIKKYTNNSVDAQIYICVYDGDGKLNGVKIIGTDGEFSWEQDTIHTFDTQMQIDGGSTLRAYVMDSSMIPLAQKSTFDESIKDEVKIFLAGDSTVCPYKDTQRPQAGWGEYIGTHFTDSVIIVNKAVGSRSTKSFYNEGRLDKIFEEADAGDYLFIQLGHNDTGAVRSSHTEAETTYKEYLRLYVNEAREKEMYPVLITPVERFGFVDDEMKSRHGNYPQAMIEVAEEMNVPLIDLRKKSNEFFSALGEEASKPYYMVSVEPYTDYTHLTQTGAKAVAELVSEGISELALPLCKHLNTK